MIQTKRNATIRDIARVAKVSETTVSLAFQDHSRISVETRERVLNTAELLNYTPNLAARRLRNGRTRTIGILVNDITNPFYATMVRALANIADRNGYGIFIVDSQWDPMKELREVQRLIESRVEGVLACFCEKTNESIALLERHEIPYLALDTYPKNFTGAFVANDLAAAARMVANHLATIGCLQPVLFTVGSGASQFSAFALIRQEFERQLKKHGLSLRVVVSSTRVLTIEDGVREFTKLIMGGHKFDAVFCLNSLFALGVIEQADRFGLRIGRDLAVVGIDDLDICSLSRIALTTIRQPYEKLAELACNELKRLIAGKPAALRVLLKPELRIRSSSGSFFPKRTNSTASGMSRR